MVFMGSMMIILFAFGNDIAAFISEDKALIINSANCLRIFEIGYLFYAFRIALVQSYNREGNTKIPTMGKMENV